MPTLWAQTADYASISVGDDLPILVKFEFRPPVQDGEEAHKTGKHKESVKLLQEALAKLNI